MEQAVGHGQADRHVTGNWCMILWSWAEHDLGVGPMADRRPGCGSSEAGGCWLGMPWLRVSIAGADV